LRCRLPRRGARAAESDGLENRCVLWAPWVQIPPPPLQKRRTGRHRGGRWRVGDRDAAFPVERKDLVHALLISFGVIFVAELGDKTMLATITLATEQGVLGTWAGSTLGMVAADALAIVVGQQLGARLPERAIKIGAAASFVVFGSILLIEGIRG